MDDWQGKGRECVMHRNGRTSVRRVWDSLIDLLIGLFAVQDKLCCRTYPLNSTRRCDPVKVQVVPIYLPRSTKARIIKFVLCLTTPLTFPYSNHAGMALLQSGLSREVQRIIQLPGSQMEPDSMVGPTKGYSLSRIITLRALPHCTQI